MAGFEDYRQRLVVPRWRKFEETARRGEVGPLRSLKEPRFTAAMIEELLWDWKLHPTLWVALDLVGAAFTLGLDKLSTDAAHFVYNHTNSSRMARNIAAQSLRHAGIDVAEEPDEDPPSALISSGRPLTPTERHFAIEIQKAKARLIEFPRNPLLWNNLALFYVSMGQSRHAERAIRTALSLAPNDRLILRSTSRYFLHQGEKELAHQIIAQNPRVTSDPWLLSAEIALATARGRTSKNMRAGRKCLESSAYSPLHLSELASAIGTLETREGNRRGGQKLIRVSLRQPSENAIAQAAWLARNHQLDQLANWELSHSSEAKAWYSWKIGDWDSALREIERWQLDQPFSGKPAILGSFISDTILGDYDSAVRYIEEGRRSNRNDSTLLNNLACALAQRGDVEQARIEFEKIDKLTLDQPAKAAWVATKGLIAFRSGNPETGRQLYEEAIQNARASKDWRAAVARIHLAFEELRIASPNAEESRKLALEAASEWDYSWVRAFAARLQKF